MDRATELKIALSRLPGANVTLLGLMDQHDLEIEDIFTRKSTELQHVLGGYMQHWLADEARDKALIEGRSEAEYAEANGIQMHFYGEDNYPDTLMDLPDAPMVLYSCGTTDFDFTRAMSVVGTRKPTPYGVNFVERLIGDMAPLLPGTCVVSGLAYGIDAAAHSAALRNGLPTVAVVAHGLQMIYPAQHRGLAADIIRKGGAIISEYPHRMKPFRNNFLQRNRIVAGLTPLTIVAESPMKGGAMSTANCAFSYGREVAALPGRTSDETSAGCNSLIRRNKASLVGSCSDVMELMGWMPLGLNPHAMQRSLFPALEGDEKIIYDFLLSKREPASTDEIKQMTRLPISTVLSLLPEMEFNGVVIRHPGSRYTIS